MFNLIPKGMSPVKVGYYSMRIVSVLNRKGRPWSLILLAYNLIVIISLIYFTVLEMLLVHGSIQEVAQGASFIAATIPVCGKIANAVIRQREIEEFLQKLEDMRCEILNDPETRIILIKSDLFINKLFSLVATFAAIFPISTLIINFLADYITQSERPHLSLPIYVPWDMKEFWPYVAGHLWVWLQTATISIIYMTFPTFNISLNYQLTVFLKILQTKLEKYVPNRKNIQDHARINLMIQQFNELFSAQFYLEICFTCLQQCGFSFSLIKAIKAGDPVALDLMYKFSYAFIGPGLICACGQEISTQMEKLHYSAYRSNWYEKSPKDRATLALVMTSTVNPVTINYRRLAYFNFVLLASVLQGAFSYITVLCNLDGNI